MPNPEKRAVSIPTSSLKKNPHQGSLNLGVVWTLPAGWKEVPGQGMRKSTLLPPGLEKGGVSVIVLGGMAGGTSANISRWARQLGLNLSSEQLSSFVNAQEKLQPAKGVQALLIDFSTLQSPEKKTMLAAIVPTGNQTWFFKFTGETALLKKHAKDFKTLCRSIRFSTSTSQPKKTQ